MNWLKSASSSLSSVLGLIGSPTEALLQERTEEIRSTMLNILGEKGASIHPALRRRLIFATDIESLWYLRSEWMGALSTLHGERIAAAHLRSVNMMFEGMLAKGMNSRSSPLSQ